MCRDEHVFVAGTEGADYLQSLAQYFYPWIHLSYQRIYILFVFSYLCCRAAHLWNSIWRHPGRRCQLFPIQFLSSAKEIVVVVLRSREHHPPFKIYVLSLYASISRSPLFMTSIGFPSIRDLFWWSICVSEFLYFLFVVLLIIWICSLLKWPVVHGAMGWGQKNFLS